MGKKVGILGVCVLALIISSCGSSPHEAIIEKMIDLLDELVDVMSTIKDESGANALYSKIEIMKAEMKKIEDEMKTLGPPTVEVQQKINEKYQDELMDVSMKFATEMNRLMMIPGIDAQLGQALAAIPPSSGSG